MVCVIKKYALSEEKIHRKFLHAVHKHIPGNGFSIPWAHHISGCHGEENFPIKLGGEEKFITLKVFKKLKYQQSLF